MMNETLQNAELEIQYQSTLRMFARCAVKAAILTFRDVKSDNELSGLCRAILVEALTKEIRLQRAEMHKSAWIIRRLRENPYRVNCAAFTTKTDKIRGV